MSIRIHNLTKRYGSQRAVDAVSFEVSSGGIVGFLGPNGAGKSTTMKVICGYIPPDEGRVTVCDLDVQDNPIGVKRLIGYLPEHNPLYHDMYVEEYLRFVAGVHGMPAATARQRTGEMISRCGLQPERHKLIGALSKGYRQRVGLAQALIHDPSVLILDEPTSGLDPNQLIEIRQLIRSVSEKKTVLFSTHILQEVEALCDRVVVINQGKIVANDELRNLTGKGSLESVFSQLTQTAVS